MSPRAAAARAVEPAQARRRFVDALGHLYGHFGLSLTFGRAFALLLLLDQPISLDELAQQLEVSKSAVSVATRDLERAGVAHRVTQPGSRRVLYEASDDLVPIFQAQFTRIRQSLPVFQAAVGLPTPGRAAQRLRDVIELHEFWLAEADGILQRWHRRARKAGR